MMNVYFTFSLTGEKFYDQNYRKIIEVILGCNCNILNTSTLKRTPEDVEKESEQEAEAYYKQMFKWIRKADVVVAEVSYPSLGVGHEISLALNECKPVIALFTQNKVPYAIESIHDDKLQILDYDLDTISEVFDLALQEAKKQLYVRFTLLLSPDIINHLNEISKKGKSRSEYIRNLIRGDIGKIGK